MSATVEARRLTEAHRRAQAAIGAQTVALMANIWPLLDPEDLDGTFERWLRAATPVIQGQRSTAARLAANYLDLFKKLELGTGATLPLVLAGPAPVEAVSTSLLVTGPVSVKSAMTRGVDLVRAMDVAQARSAAAAMRHAGNGANETITATAEADRQALGWARATSASPCSFCALVAGRGPVYKSEGTANFEPHDACNCRPEVVYRDDAQWPPGSQRFADVYAEAKAADGDTMSNFRRLIEAA